MVSRLPLSLSTPLTTVESNRIGECFLFAGDDSSILFLLRCTLPSGKLSGFYFVERLLGQIKPINSIL